MSSHNPFLMCMTPDLPNQDLFPYINAFLTVFVLVFFALCLRHALRSSSSGLVYLLSASVFGYFLEIAMIYLTKSYCYNPRWVGLVGPVPLAIALSWGILIYTTRQIIEATNLSLVAGSLFQAFFTVVLDFILDPVAVRLSLWTWGLDLESNVPDFTKDYFGIPWGNYWGWHWAIFSFSLMFMLVSRFLDGKMEEGALRALITGILTIVIGLVLGFIIIMAFGYYEQAVPSSLGQSIVIVLLFLVDISLAVKERLQYTEPVDGFARMVFVSYFLLFSALWVPVSGTIPVLLGVIVTTGLAVYLVLFRLGTVKPKVPNTSQ